MSEKNATTVLNYAPFDADQHYYEAEDAFTRYLDRKMRHRGIDWAEVQGRRRLLVGGQINRFIPNPTFDPVARPGCLDDYFRGRNPDKLSIKELFGELEPIRAEYRNRDSRILSLNNQNIGACLMFPTLAVGMEEALKADIPAMLAVFRAFNRWLEEDWGFAYHNRIFSAPYFVLSDLQWALEELEWALTKGVRVIVMRSAPVIGATGTLSPADRRFDPFWARIEEAGVSVAYHAGDSGYLPFTAQWGVNDEFQAFDYNPKSLCMSASPIQDLCATLICDGLFDRFSRLRIATVESGSDWVPNLIKKFKKAFGQMPTGFTSDPVEILRRNIWVSPYYEDDIKHLASLIGEDRILFGSDYPHAEGLAVPTEFVKDLVGFDSMSIKKIMHDNAWAYLG